jgi:hypothetical protein
MIRHQIRQNDLNHYHFLALLMRRRHRHLKL